MKLTGAQLVALLYGCRIAMILRATGWRVGFQQIYVRTITLGPYKLMNINLIGPFDFIAIFDWSEAGSIPLVHTFQIICSTTSIIYTLFFIRTLE